MVIVHLHCCIPDINLATYNVACSSLGTPPWVKSGLMEQLLFSEKACACMRPRGPFKLDSPPFSIASLYAFSEASTSFTPGPYSVSKRFRPSLTDVSTTMR